MNSDNSTTTELTEEEMNQSTAVLGMIIAGAATSLVVIFSTMKFMKWNDARKSKKNTEE